jgi:GNAT superfamily N-acetyltransferase
MSELRPPTSEAEWNAYHDLRRRILFERRGRAASYDPNHPDERRDGNHPHLFFHDGAPVGTVRIDIDGALAIFRLVTIREDLQRQGLGREMLRQAEAFALSQRCWRIESHVARDAEGFYARCGFHRVNDEIEPGDTVLMAKPILAQRDERDLTDEEFNAILDRELETLESDVLPIYERYVAPVRRMISYWRMGTRNVATPIWVIARDGPRVVGYDEVEGDFGTGVVRHEGFVENWGTYGELLRWTLIRFPDHMFDGPRSGLAQPIPHSD